MQRGPHQANNPCAQSRDADHRNYQAQQPPPSGRVVAQVAVHHRSVTQEGPIADGKRAKVAGLAYFTRTNRTRNGRTIAFRHVGSQTWARYRKRGNCMANSSSGFFSGFLLLTVRGVLLWVVLPLGCAAWVLVAPWLHRRGIKFGQFLGWIDINLVVLVQRSLLRPFYRKAAPPWVPATEMSGVKHRVGMIDLY